MADHQVHDLTPEEVSKGMTDGRYLLVDVREPNEVAVEAYPGGVVALSSGDKISLRKLTNKEMLQAGVSAGADLDQEAHFFVNSLRFAVLDDDGNQLLRSFEEAAQFINTFDADDFLALRDAVAAVQPSLHDEEVMEAGKAS